MNLPDDVQVVLLALGWSGAAGAVGLLVIRRLPRRSVRLDLAAVAAVAVVSLLAGVTGAARAMFLSVHDLTVVVRVALVAAPVALLVAVLAGRTVVRDVDRVRRRAAALAGEAAPAPGPPRLRELAALDDDLTDVGARLAGARAQQEALERSRRELVAWVSHDLRTPLAALRATVEALEDGLAPDPARARRQVLREVDRLSALVDDLRELSGIQAGALPLHPEPVDLRDVAREAVEGAAAPAAARGVLLDPVDAPAGVTVVADAGTLARVAGNLVANAVRYSRPGGRVRVTVTVRDGAGVLAVRDACGGIPAADRERVFEPGWRAEGARTPGPDGGSGLGLAVARGLARANGGDVVLADASDGGDGGGAGGCCFEVVLPGRADGTAVRPASPR